MEISRNEQDVGMSRLWQALLHIFRLFQNKFCHFASNYLVGSIHNLSYSGCLNKAIRLNEEVFVKLL
jgi:hypothetical protein